MGRGAGSTGEDMTPTERGLAILEDLRAPCAPLPCRACEVIVTTFHYWFFDECPATEDGLHDVPGYLRLPFHKPDVVQ